MKTVWHLHTRLQTAGVAAAAARQEKKFQGIPLASLRQFTRSIYHQSPVYRSPFLRSAPQSAAQTPVRRSSMADDPVDAQVAQPPIELGKTLRCCVPCRLIKTFEQFYEEVRRLLAAYGTAI
jgi:hypothetical protein